MMISFTSRSKVIYLLYFISIILFRTHGQLFEGSKCSINGTEGICKLLSNCTLVYNLLLAGEPPQKVCGYLGFDPIVCCPKEEDNHLNDTLNKIPSTSLLPPIDTRGALARAKCKEYFKYVSQLKGQHNFINNNRVYESNVFPDGIIGGTVTVIGEFPHMVALGYNTSNNIQWKCGGSLISKRFVLTAAHCLISLDGIYPSVVRVNYLNRALVNQTYARDYKIIKRIPNPEYKPPSEYHDIALLELETDVEINEYVKPACLQTTLPDTPENKTIATGWGLTDWESQIPSKFLLKVTLDIANQSYCNESYTTPIDYRLNRGIVSEWQICAGQLDHDTCQGDSGGPLSTFNYDYNSMYNVVGITSVGKLCGFGIPGVYTKVYYYVPWLESVIWAEHD